MDIDQIKCMATDQDWDFLRHYEKNKLLRFVRNEVRLDIWYPKMTVGIFKHGQAIYKKFVSEKLLDKIFSEN